MSAPVGASPEAAAVEQRRIVCDPRMSPRPTAWRALDAARATSLAAVPDGQAKDDGIAVSEDEAAESDGPGGQRRNVAGSPSSIRWPHHQGLWQATPSCPINPATGLRVGISYQVAHMTPLAIAEPLGLPTGASAGGRQLPLLHGTARGDDRGRSRRAPSGPPIAPMSRGSTTESATPTACA